MLLLMHHNHYPPHHLIGLLQLDCAPLLASVFSAAAVAAAALLITFCTTSTRVLPKSVTHSLLTAYHAGQWVYCVKNWPLTTCHRKWFFLLLFLLLLPPSLTDSGSFFLIPIFPADHDWADCVHTALHPNFTIPQFDHTFAGVHVHCFG